MLINFIIPPPKFSRSATVCYPVLCLTHKNLILIQSTSLALGVQNALRKHLTYLNSNRRCHLCTHLAPRSSVLSKTRNWRYLQKLIYCAIYLKQDSLNLDSKRKTWNLFLTLDFSSIIQKKRVECFLNVKHV